MKNVIYGILLFVLSAIAMLLTSPAARCADAVVRDDANGDSFVPAVEFCGDALDDGLYLSVGLLHSDCHYKAEEPVDLLLSLRDPSGIPRRSFTERIDDEYQVRMATQRGAPKFMTESGRRVVAGYEESKPTMLHSGQSVAEIYHLSRYYSFSDPGTYALFVVRTIRWSPGNSGSGGSVVLRHEVGPINIVIGDVGQQEIAKARAANRQQGGHVPDPPGKGWTLRTTLLPDKPDERWLRESHQPGISPLQKQAYEQLSRICLCDHPGLLVYGGVLDLKAGSESPTRALYNMGVDAVPVLAEALEDTTVTRVVRDSGGHRGPYDVWKVNGLVALVIRCIAGKEFLVGGDKYESGLLLFGVQEYPRMIPEARQQVLDWYEHNRDRPTEDGRIADLNDAYPPNRIDAVKWLGLHKITQAGPAIVDYINRSLASRVHSSLEATEMAEGSLALGNIGDVKNIDAVRRACKWLTSSGLGFRNYLFKAYHGLALLGEKTEALKELEDLYNKSTDPKNPNAVPEGAERKEFQQSLEEARSW